MDNNEVMAAYQRHQRRRNLAGTTIAAAGRELKRLASWLGDVPLLEATFDLLDEWADEIEGHCSANSKYVKISRVHSFYKWAYEFDHIPAIPTARVTRPQTHETIPRPMPVESIVAALSKADTEMRLWIMLAGYAGFRCCEIAGLTREQILDTAEPPKFRIIGKRQKERIVYICDDLLAELRAYPLPSRGYVFQRRDGQPGPPTAAIVSIYGNKFLHEVAGVPETMHQLRHRFGTDVYRASDLPTAAKLLGHSNIQTTRGYAKLDDAATAKAVQSLRLPDAARRTA